MISYKQTRFEPWCNVRVQRVWLHLMSNSLSPTSWYTGLSFLGPQCGAWIYTIGSVDSMWSVITLSWWPHSPVCPHFSKPIYSVHGCLIFKATWVVSSSSCPVMFKNYYFYLLYWALMVNGNGPMLWKCLGLWKSDILLVLWIAIKKWLILQTKWVVIIQGWKIWWIDQLKAWLEKNQQPLLRPSHDPYLSYVFILCWIHEFFSEWLLTPILSHKFLVSQNSNTVFWC